MKPRITLLTLTAALFATSSVALGDEVGMLVDATIVKPTGESGRVSNSLGYGAEIRMMPHREPFTVSFGGFFGLGERQPDKVARDLYDFHFNIGFKASKSRRRHLIPFLTVGLDVLFITSHQPDGATFKGTTLGLNASAGFLGHISDTWVYRVNGSYLGAIVPGTGDDLGGLVLQAGVGKLLGD